MTPVFVPRAAGLTAGSIPTKETAGYSSRSREMAAAVAVLQATTMMSAPIPRRMSVTARARSWMYVADFSPYGQCALSAK